LSCDPSNTSKREQQDSSKERWNFDGWLENPWIRIKISCQSSSFFFHMIFHSFQSWMMKVRFISAEREQDEVSTDWANKILQSLATWDRGVLFRQKTHENKFKRVYKTGCHLFLVFERLFSVFPEGKD
jgi:hypothetical protein